MRRVVEFCQGSVEDFTEFLNPRLIGRGINRDDFLSRSGREDFAEFDPLEIAVFLQEPTEELGGVGFFFLRQKRGGGNQRKGDPYPQHQKLTLIWAPSTRAFGMFPVPPGLMIHWRFGCTYANFVI